MEGCKSSEFVSPKTEWRTAYYHLVSNSSNLVLYIHGYMSSRDAYKGKQIMQFCKDSEVDFFGYDGLGFGASNVLLQDVKFSDRIRQAQELISDLLIAQFNYDKIIIVGSSMGGFVAAVLARDFEILRQKLGGVILLCPAITFPFGHYELFKEQFTDEQSKMFENGEVVEVALGPSQIYLSKEIVEDSQGLSFQSNKPITGDFPVKLVWGDNDEHVPIELSRILLEKITPKERAEFVLIEGGDHYLARQEDIIKQLDLLKELLQLK